MTSLPRPTYPEALQCPGCGKAVRVRTYTTAWCAEGHKIEWPEKLVRPIDQIERIMRHAMHRGEWMQVLRLLVQLEDEELLDAELDAATEARNEERDNVFADRSL